MRTRPQTRFRGATVAGRPRVFLNMAMTADGKIATANRAISSFGSAQDQEHLLELRAEADAIMAGARTIDLNPVTLGPGNERFRRLRLRRGLAEYPLRIVVSRAATVEPTAEIFRHRFSPIILLTTGKASESRLKRLRDQVDEVCVGGEKEIDFCRVLADLHRRWEIDRLLVEGGGELNDALFRCGLVDELHLTICPRIVGGRAAPTIADGLGAGVLARATTMELTKACRLGNELFLVFRAKRKAQG